MLDGEKFVHFDTNLTIRRSIDRFLRRHGVGVETVLEFDNIENIKRAVEIPSGVAILPAPTLEREVRSGTLAAIRFSDFELTRPLAIIHRKSEPLGLTATRFLALLSDGIADATPEDDPSPSPALFKAEGRDRRAEPKPA
jgi:DNA-binding transcriptional LysR family regulator